MGWPISKLRQYGHLYLPRQDCTAYNALRKFPVPQGKKDRYEGNILINNEHYIDSSSEVQVANLEGNGRAGTDMGCTGFLANEPCETWFWEQSGQSTLK